MCGGINPENGPDGTRPHRGLQLHPPNGQVHGVSANGEIICRQTLGGLLREYSRAPMSAAA